MFPLAICTGSPHKYNKTKKELKGIQIWKEERKLPVFAGDVIAWVGNSKEPTKKQLELISNYDRFAGYRLICKSQWLLYILKINDWNLKFKTQYHL